MSWERYDDSGERWSRTADDERHLLVFDATSGELREYHEVPGGAPTVHVYRRTAETLWNADSPLGFTVHTGETYTVAGNFAPWVRALDDFELIDWLMGAKYVNAV